MKAPVLHRLCMRPGCGKPAAVLEGKALEQAHRQGVTVDYLPRLYCRECEGKIEVQE